VVQNGEHKIKNLDSIVVESSMSESNIDYQEDSKRILEKVKKNEEEEEKH